MTKKLKLRGKCMVYIDWANVHGWEKSLRRAIDQKKLYKYLKSYEEIEPIKFYFGTDITSKSKNFLTGARKTGFRVVTKPVKYIFAGMVDGQKLKRRKCDFDMEICIDVHRDLARGIESFIFFTGDGDFEPLYKLLVEKQKQAIVVYSPGHLGREIWEIKKGLFKIQLSHLGL